jgi:APA family basic amino acid/polyamine antiporter
VSAATGPVAQRLTALDGAALVVSTVIGAGIFLVPSLIASLTGGPAAFFGVWVVGALLSLAGAMTYAELASRIPLAGGEYVYIREAFGPIAGFLSGWTSFVAGFSGAIAASAVGLGVLVQTRIPGLDATPWSTVAVGPLRLVLSAATVIALAVIAVFTLVALSNVPARRVVTNGLSIVLVLAMLVFIIGGTGTEPPLHLGGRPFDLGGFAAALVPVMFTYSGWNAAAYVSAEFRDPRRDVPRALIAGTLVVGALYVGVNFAMVRGLGIGGLAAAAAPAEAVAREAFGTGGGTLVSLLICLALASSVCAMVVTGPRVYLQMARDGAMPAFFGSTRASDGNPVSAIVAQSVWSAILVLTGTFNALVTYTGVAIVLFSAAAVASIFPLRRRGGPGPSFQVSAFPAIPLVFIGASVWMLVASVRREPAATLAGIGVIVAGMPVYLWRRRVSRSAGTAGGAETA